LAFYADANSDAGADADADADTDADAEVDAQRSRFGVDVVRDLASSDTEKIKGIKALKILHHYCCVVIFVK